MKKLLLIAASTAILSSTAMADGVENTFYIKANAGASKLNKVTDKSSSLKLKSKTAAILGLGVGYYIMDNVRTDLTLDFLLNPELKKTGANKDVPNSTVSVKHKPTITTLMASGYVDLFDISVAKVFAGAGVGLAQVKEKISGSVTVAGRTIDRSTSTKKKNNLAYHLTLGAAAEVAPGANAELSYSWRDFGKTKSQKKVAGVDTGQELSKTSYKGHHVLAGIRFDL